MIKNTKEIIMLLKKMLIINIQMDIRIHKNFSMENLMTVMNQQLHNLRKGKFNKNELY